MHGTVSLYVDGTKTGEGRVEATVPMMFSADETCDVGSDTASPVSDGHEEHDRRAVAKIGDGRPSRTMSRDGLDPRSSLAGGADLSRALAPARGQRVQHDHVQRHHSQ
jgi:hypothetical protein